MPGCVCSKARAHYKGRINLRVIVLGSGVIGVASAWYLVQAGHEVTVVDRQPGAALETSFANAGELSPGCASPWAAPGLPLKALGWMMEKHAPLIVKMRADPAMLKWLVAMVRNCNEESYAINKSRMARIAEFSRDCMVALRQKIHLSYDHQTLGSLQIFRDEASLYRMENDIQLLRASGLNFELLDSQGCIRIEPGLAGANVAGGLRFPLDETGDCHKFSVALAAHAAEAGVKFVYNQTINKLSFAGDHITGVETDSGVMRANAYVACLGSYSPQLLSQLGIRLPVYPVKGYSLTTAIADPNKAPRSTVIDDQFKVAITRLGDTIRIGGIAEVAGYDRTLLSKRKTNLERALNTLFGGGADLNEAKYWTGLRPMTPDGTPVIGSTAIRNLYLNTGHGAFGWTMACGSGQLIAEIISGKETSIQSDDLSLSRYA